MMNICRIILRRNLKCVFRPNKILINQYWNKNISSSLISNKYSHELLINLQRRKLHSSVVLWQDVIIKTPQFAESVSEGDIRWEKAVGDTVQVDDLIGEIETDKTAIPVHASCSGTISALLVGDGDKVVADQDLAKITPGEVSKSAPVEIISPNKADIEPIKVKDSEVKPEKEVEIKPLQNAKLIKVITPPPQLKITMPDISGADRMSGSRGEQRVKMNRMRLRIAQRLKDAQNTCAMLTTFNECDMSSIIELRLKYKDQFLKKHGVKLGFMSAFVKACAVALHDQPVVNAVIDNTDIVYRDYVDISVAVSTPRGLVVPVLRDAHNMNFAQIEKGIFELGEKARLGQLAIEDMDGGTFTISNGGVFGSLLGTPIINPPQSAILGIHATQSRPVAIDNKVEIRPMMYLALTYDHRLVDGKEAVTFLRKIKSFIEDPRMVLLDL